MNYDIEQNRTFIFKSMPEDYFILMIKETPCNDFTYVSLLHFIDLIRYFCLAILALNGKKSIPTYMIGQQSLG